MLSPLLVGGAALHPLRIRRRPGLRQGIPVPLQAGAGILDGVIRADEGDVAMAQPQQMASGGGGPQPVVEGDAAPLQRGNIAIDQHHARHSQGIIDQLLVRERLAVHHQRLAAFADQQLDGAPLLLGVVKTITHQQMQTLLHRRGTDSLDQGAKEGIRHVIHHYPHGVAGAIDQGPRVGIGGIAELGHGLQHHFARGGTRLGGVVHHP